MSSLPLSLSLCATQRGDRRMFVCVHKASHCSPLNSPISAGVKNREHVLIF